MKALAHVARHDLPVSNGWSGCDEEVTVWCGRCKNNFTPDAAWVNRYFDAQRRSIDGRGGFDPFEWRPFTDEENRKALDAIEADRALLLRRVAPSDSQPEGVAQQ